MKTFTTTRIIDPQAGRNRARADGRAVSSRADGAAAGAAPMAGQHRPAPMAGRGSARTVMHVAPGREVLARADRRQ